MLNHMHSPCLCHSVLRICAYRFSLNINKLFQDDHIFHVFSELLNDFSRSTTEVRFSSFLADDEGNVRSEIDNTNVQSLRQMVTDLQQDLNSRECEIQNKEDRIEHLVSPT